MKGTVTPSGGLQIATVTLDAKQINYKTGVTIAKQFNDILDTLQWTEVSEKPQA